MDVFKAQYSNEKRAKQAVIEMEGIKLIRRGSAVIWMSNMQNTKQAVNAYNSNGGYTVWPTKEDEAELLSSL
jgi:hypothetical protein